MSLGLESTVYMEILIFITGAWMLLENGWKRESEKHSAEGMWSEWWSLPKWVLQERDCNRFWKAQVNLLLFHQSLLLILPKEEECKKWIPGLFLFQHNVCLRSLKLLREVVVILLLDPIQASHYLVQIKNLSNRCKLPSPPTWLGRAAACRLS